MTAADTSWMTRRVSVLTPRAGRITFWAGVLGAASGGFLAVRPSAVPGGHRRDPRRDHTVSDRVMIAGMLIQLRLDAG